MTGGLRQQQKDDESQVQNARERECETDVQRTVLM
jgi:hypothetical protein